MSRGGMYYGSFVAEPLTKDQLLHALALIQSEDSNMDYLLQFDGYGFSDGHEAEAARKCAEELYSDALLERLNAEMMPVYSADTDMSDSAVSEIVMTAEGEMGHGIEMLPKIWPKPAVRVGSISDSGGSYGGYMYYHALCTYIDIDGDVFVVRCSSILYDEDVRILESRELVSGSDDFSLDEVQDLFPETFRGFWDR